MTTSPKPVATPLAPPRRVRIEQKLNLRGGPAVGFARIGRLEPGDTLMVDRVIDGEAYLGRRAWYGVEGREHYFWSGAAQFEDAATPVPAAPAGAVAPDVHRRGNGTILPLSQAELAGTFGAFQSTPGAQRGSIVITPAAWVTQHIAPFSHPVLAALGHPAVSLHRLAHPHFQAVFDRIDALGLGSLIQTFDGGWVPRHKNWDPGNPDLSSHSWGVAIDLNARWNGAGHPPASPGQQGDLTPLVPLFAAQGFAWGGHFSSNVDGMHFELARRNP